jgi:hypothetical protein
MASQDLTPEALEGFAAQLDGKPAHEACPHYTSSPAGMAWLVGAWLQKTGRPRRAMSGCRAATRCASATCACRSPTPRPWFVFSEGEPAMSDHAYRLLLMKRALARSDAELFGHRPRYLEVARRLAALLLSTELP